MNNHIVIEKSVHKWLVGLSILNPRVKYPEVGAHRVELDDVTTRRVSSGEIMYKILEKAFDQSEFVSKHRLFPVRSSLNAQKSIKDKRVLSMENLHQSDPHDELGLGNNSPEFSPLKQNWEFITECLLNMGIAVDSRTVSQISSGNFQGLPRILLDLYRASQEARLPQIDKSPLPIKNSQRKLHEFNQNPDETLDIAADESIDLNSSQLPPVRSQIKTPLGSQAKKTFTNNPNNLKSSPVMGFSQSQDDLSRSSDFKFQSRIIRSSKQKLREKPESGLGKGYSTVANVNQLKWVNLSEINTEKKIQEIKDPLELLIVLVSKHFQVSSNQAALLLSGSRLYLAHMISKGLKGDFSSTLSFFMDLETCLPNIIKSLCPKNPTTEEVESGKMGLTVLLDLLKPGVISRSEFVAHEAIELISKIGLKVEENSVFKREIWSWFISEEGFLTAWKRSLKRHVDLSSELLRLPQTFGGKLKTNEFYQRVLFEKFEKLKDYFLFMHSIIPKAVQEKSIKAAFDENSFKGKLYQEGLSASGDQTPNELRFPALMILGDILTHVKLSDEECLEMTSRLEGLFSLAMRTRGTIWRVQLATQTLGVTESLVEKGKFQEAEKLYKMLGDCIGELHSDEIFREFTETALIEHFSSVFLSYKSPKVVISLSEPFFRALAINEGSNFVLNFPDVKFIVSLVGVCVQMKRFDWKMLNVLVDFLVRMYFKQVIFSSLAFEGLLDAIQNVPIPVNDSPEKKGRSSTIWFHVFCAKTLKAWFSVYFIMMRKSRSRLKLDVLGQIRHVMHLEEQSKGLPFPKIISNDQEAFYKQVKRKGGTLPERELEAERLASHKRSLLIHFAQALIKTNDPKMNQLIRSYAIFTNLQLKNLQIEDGIIKPLNSPGMIQILSFLGDPKRIIAQHEQATEYSMLKGIVPKYGEEEDEFEDLADLRRSSFAQKKANQEMKLPSDQTKEKAYEMARKKRAAETADPRVLLVIRAKQEEFGKRKEEEKVKELSEKIRKENQKEHLKRVIELRNIEFGVPTRGPDIIKSLIQPLNTIRDIEKAKKSSGKANFKVMNAHDEEGSVMEAVAIIEKNLRPALKQVFDEYSKQGVKMAGEDFTRILGEAQWIHQKDILSFVRKQGLSQFVEKQQVLTLVRDVKVKVMGDQIDVMSLNYEGFVQMVMNLAVMIFSQPRFGMGHLPISFLLNEFIEHLKKVWAADGKPTLIFTEPEAVFYIDPDVILHLNKKLASKNKEIVKIPKMLEVYEAQKVDFIYGLPSNFKIGSSLRIAYDIVDDILFENFDFHILPLRHRIKKIQKVRPRPPFLPENIKRGELHLSKEDLEPNPASKPEKGKEREIHMSKAAESSLDLEFLVKELPIFLRVELANFGMDERGRAIEVAYSLDKLFDAIEHQRTEGLTLAGTGRMNTSFKANRANKAKRNTENAQKEAKQIKDELIAKRQEELERMRPQLKEWKQEKRERKKSEEQQRREKEEKKRQKEKEIHDEFWKEKYENAKSQKERQWNEKNRLESEEKDKEIEMENERKEAFKEFIKKEARKLRDKEKESKEKREKEKEEQEEKEKMDKEKFGVNRERFLKRMRENKTEREIEVEKSINEFKESAEVKKLLGECEPSLKVIYKFFVKGQEKTMGVLPERKAMLFLGLVNLLTHFGITPFLVPPQKVRFYYNWALRQKKRDEYFEDGLDFGDLLGLLVRVAMKCPEQLERLAGKAEEARKEKERIKEEQRKKREERERVKREKEEEEKKKKTEEEELRKRQEEEAKRKEEIQNDNESSEDSESEKEEEEDKGSEEDEEKGSEEEEDKDSEEEEEEESKEKNRDEEEEDEGSKSNDEEEDGSDKENEDEKNEGVKDSLKSLDGLMFLMGVPEKKQELLRKLASQKRGTAPTMPSRLFKKKAFLLETNDS